MAAALVACTVLPIAACNFPSHEVAPPDTDPFAGETLAPSEVRYDVRDGKGYLRWAATEGAEGYRIFRSVGRFGDFEPVNSDALLEETSYVAESDLYCYYRVTAVTAEGEKEVGGPVCAFSDETLIVSPGDDMAAVQATIDETHSALEKASDGQFSPRRSAVILLPGDYPSLDLKVGYYTTVSGAGETPNDVRVGSLYVSTNVLSNNNSTCTFWRGAENFTVSGSTRWAVSQGTSLRRMQFVGDLSLSHPSGWSSGGFLANSYITGRVDPGTQQQWFSRNDEWNSWSSIGSHNYVFSGCKGGVPAHVWSESGGRSTVLPTTECMAEKPFLVYSEQEGYRVFVPLAEHATCGVTWGNGISQEFGYFLPMRDFYIANERDNAETLNAALRAGYHLFFPPGHYSLEKPLEIERENTVVMGLGYATLEIADENSDCAIRVDDVGGVRLADLLIEAGAYSENMVVLGERGAETSHASNPIVVSDLYLRIGGVANVHTETDTALAIYANDVLGDNFWIWRGDHSQGVAWEDTSYDAGGHTVTEYGNPVQTGILVEGDRVSCYALMVEHCRGYQTLWKGEDGLTVMYQSETPYRVPSQEKWMSGSKNGCASYKVADEVERHRAYGIGVYLVNYDRVNLASAIEAPEKAGICMEHLVICDFTQGYPATISNVINDLGGGVGPDRFRSLVVRFPSA